MIRWLRGETVEDSCPELALIFCAMVAKGILSPFSVGCSLFILSNVPLFFCQLFLSPSSGVSLFFPLDISLFLSQEAVRAFFYRSLLSRAHILVRVPRGTLGCVPVSYVRSALFARSIRDFIAEEWTYLLCKEGEEKESRFLHT